MFYTYIDIYTYICVYIYLYIYTYIFLWGKTTPQVSVAAITNDHKLGGLKQQKFILSQFWRLEVWNQSVGKATLPLETLGKNTIMPLLASGGSQHSLAHGCITPVSAPSLHYFFLLVSVSNLSLIRIHLKHLRYLNGMWWHLVPNWIVQDNLPISKSLT